MTAAVLLLAAAAAAAAPDLAEGFRHPPAAAKPHTWWHWMNGNVSKEGITADLEAMREIGLGGAQIFDIDYGIPRGPVDFASSAWRDCVKHAAYEARRLGLELVLNTASGWSCAGAPWTVPTNGMKFVTCRERRVKGPCRFDGRIAEPPFEGNYGRRTHYEDVAVLAYPTPATNSAAPLARFSSKVFRCRDQAASQFGGRFDKLQFPGGLVTPEATVDLTDRRQPDGRIVWDVPDGDWTILRIGWNDNGRVNYPPSACGRGFECDKLSSAALDAHWAGLMDTLLKDLAPVVGRRDGKGGITGIVIDSYEAGSQNWTPGLDRAFERRTGYPLRPWLPVFAGRIVGSTELTERFLEDFRRVVSEELVENFGFASRRKAHAYGLELYVEPYGDDLPANQYEYARCADIPMTEFWCHPKGASQWKGGPSWGASEAHVWGKRIVGAESFTTWPKDGRWLQDPWSIKRENDQAYVRGVNRIIYHTYAHQPWTDRRLLPGMTMGRFGIMFNRNVTWWKRGKAWIDYQTRCQYLLQQGRAVSDALYFCGEDAPEKYVKGRADLRDGSDFDVLTRESLLASRAERGEIVTPGGLRCGLLLMPADGTAVSPDLLRRIDAFAAAGVTVIGEPPTRSFGLRGYPACDAEVKSLAAKIWARKNVFRRPASAALKAIGHTEDFLVLKGPVIQHIHRRADDGSDIYFVAQYSDAAISPECSFRVTGRVPELWDPETGTMRRAADWKTADGRTLVTLPLSPRGSVFVVFRPQPTAGIGTEPDWKTVSSDELRGPWEVEFRSELDGSATGRTFERLVNWSEHADEEIRHFSGTAVYRRTLACPDLSAGERLVLDLGNVKNLATVTVNGRELRTLWKPPFALDVTSALTPGENRLEIAVANTWANRLIGDEAKPEDCTWTDKRWSGPHLERWPAWWTNVASRASGRTTFATWHHWQKDDTPPPSGLLGPVVIRRERP